MKQPRNEALESAIRKSPESPAAYGVYADWLIENGDPAGELIAVQVARALKPESAALKKRERALLSRHEDRWLGAFSSDAHTWSFGFLASLSLSDPTPARYRALLELGAARFLRELDLELTPSRRTNQALIAAMIELGLPPTLRKLGLLSIDDDARAQLGDLSGLYPRLGDLRTLAIRGTDIVLGSVDLPSLEAFDLDGPIHVDVLRALGEARWPALTSLGLTWTRPIAEERSLLALLGRLALPDSPKLRHLGIAGTEHGDDLLLALAESPITSALLSLDLSRSRITDAGARVLLERRRAFEPLESIDLRENELSEEMCDVLQEAYGIAVDIDFQGEEGLDDQDDHYDDIRE